jgi:enoyl-CoA hydratase
MEKPIMTFKYLQLSTKAMISYICIDKPKTMNALDGELLNELSEAFIKCRDDADTRVIIISSKAKEYFISGGDIGHISTFSGPVDAKAHIAKIQDTFNMIEKLNKPVIAAINGLALGGGCELAMSCHIRIASENARFGQPEIKIGLIPGAGGTQRLALLCGKGIATELVLTGDMIDAERALRIGLVNHVAPKGSLMQEAERIAKRIASNAPLATQFALEALNGLGDGAVEDGLHMERDLFALLCSTSDMQEGVTAFKEKRKPNFVGK